MSSTNDTTIRDALKRKPQPKLLRKLADHIETSVKDDEFDMDSFCGTARCAFGHAPSIPAIGKLVKIKRLSYVAVGIRVYYPDIQAVNPEIDKRIARALYPDEVANVGITSVVRDYVDSFDRAQYVFGITAIEANEVFGANLFSGERKTRADVAEQLRDLASKYDGKA